MENKSRLMQWLSSIGDSLAEQQWFQELRGKWEELDPQSRMYLKLGSILATILLAFALVLSSAIHVYKIKKEYATKNDLLQLISSANDELRQLREANRGIGGSGGGPWPEYFQSSATTAGIPAEAVAVSPEKPAKAPTAGEKEGDVTVKESLFDLTVKDINVRQLVRYAYQLENGARPVKIRHLGVNAKNDLSGYLEATLAVSAFSVASK